MPDPVAQAAPLRRSPSLREERIKGLCPFISPIDKSPRVLLTQNPISAVRFGRRLCPLFYTLTGFLAESMKGGMLMKSKHCTYGKESAFRAFGYRDLCDNFRPKSNVTAHPSM